MQNCGPTDPNTQKHKHKKHEENNTEEQTKFLKTRMETKVSLEKKAHASFTGIPVRTADFAPEMMEARRQWAASPKKAPQPRMFCPEEQLSDIKVK